VQKFHRNCCSEFFATADPFSIPSEAQTIALSQRDTLALICFWVSNARVNLSLFVPSSS
jgi:hypothetical protein